MNKHWMTIILITSTCLLLTLETQKKRSLSQYFKAERALKLSHFAQARPHVSQNQIPLLELWESMLTGRVAPLDRWMRQEYKTLALAHVFTPSGFHLSALLWPLLLIFRKKKQKLILLSLIGCALLFLPGQSALKRMTSIKINQQFFGMKAGFILAIILDVLFGSFSDSPLGFTYSFLFLGIIYSGARGVTLFIWFFLAQLLISYVQGEMISPLLLVSSPIVNSVLAIILPFLFVLSWPLTGWQLTTGLFLLEHTQKLVSFFYSLILKLPILETNCALLLMVIFILMRKGRAAIIICILLSTDLNLDKQKIPLNGSWDWVARGEIIREKGQKIYREDGICRNALIKGVRFETCSPRRGSRKKET